MKQSLDKLVTDILRRMEEHPETIRTEKRLRNWLAGQGYKKRDIDAALKLLQPPEGAVTAAPSSTMSTRAVRHLSPFEAYKLTPEARDALVRLELHELISPIEREMLLERLGQFEGEVGIEDLDYLLSWLLYSMRDVESQQTIYAVFEGNQATLH